jgi:UDP-N-acetylglucosamine diphosphorylase / glucose-1-phosphate thymidylyltransferase / UDP-N-acetylgalactosamine diphosphorylase / glucosamine-1-phosphate N-acetyltransferase / galactosamine-1-phosphate N-acetyltransferase
MINIVIPMAGLGSRFADAGYENPKPFIDVDGKPMIERVLDNLSAPGVRFILLVRKEHIENYSRYINAIKEDYNSIIFPISDLTQGTACTVLLARNLINDDTPMVIANSDQIIDINFSDFIDDALSRSLDGSILTFTDLEKNPKWSFAKLDQNNHVTEVAEKKPISNYATVGIYYFKKGSNFVEGAIDMILQQDMTNGEYYSCPVYNYLVEKKLIVGIYNMEQSQMHGIGTPDDLKKYLKKI